MKKNNDKPKLRFPGFNDPWEQRKFEDMYKVISGYAFKMSDYIESGVAIINGEAIQHNKIESNNFNYLPESFSAKYSKLILDKGDIVIGLNRPITNGQLKIARIPSELSGSLLYQRAGKIESLQSTYEDFTYTLLDQEILKFTLKEAVGSDQPFISTTKLNKWNFLIPSNINEQEKIGTLFNQLDGTITLHQRKLNHLQDKKKSLLQKMFPKNGEDFPELRFPGFTDPWEQRKLGDVVERVTRKNKDLESTLPLTISAQNGLVDQNVFFNKTVASRDVSGYYLVKNGEFAYNKSYSNGYPWGAVKRLDRYDMGVLSTIYIVFNPTDVNSDFLTKYYDTTYWYRQVSKHAAEGARNHGLLNIAASDFFETELTIPKDKAEQKKIGQFFKDLDNLIALHQRKLNHLKEQKKALLQQMFI
ncbi:restriction endonuclease subunit S [Clostridium tyrobutyricum]|uniref:restriction endonuclease subunit S n=1 Tax=Clostridium tyrobutyricum TaxID=1519 RepID=UPI0011CC9CBD|nr:restriction endonuclease subunit S [Clostridium tyrobutyricum]